MTSKAVACEQCFKNAGFRAVIAAHASTDEIECPRCGSRSGPLDREALLEAMQSFFVIGSLIAETMAPVYQINESNPNPANFDPTLEADASLAADLTGTVIFDYGPPLWRVGETNLKHEFDEGGMVRERAAQRFVGAAQRMELPIGTTLYRIRKNLDADETVATAITFDPPPADIERSPGRWDDGKRTVLYASDDIELCLHECRVVVADEIVVATLSCARPLTLLDLTADLPIDGPTPFEDPNIFANFLSLSRSEDWLDHARTVARLAEAAGLDGIRYSSYYAQAKQETKALNVALFGKPIENGDIVIQSVNRLRLTDARYAFSLGPVLYQDSATRAELDAFLAATDDGTATHTI